jgi:pimeloyl-ACP methyl ester carboxylesterase
MPKQKVNHKVFSIPKNILFSGKLLAFISPKLAANFAFKLFMTPFKFKRPNKEDLMYNNSSRTMLLIPELNKKIQVYQYGKSNKRVLLIHGWAGRGTQLFKIAESFIEKGYETISFDATGHGESEGKTSAMPEFVASVFELEKVFGPFDFSIGHSLGGMALLNAVKKGFNVRKIAIVGSGNSITAICNQFISRLGLKQEIATLLKMKMDKVLGYDSEELSAYVAAKSVKIPTLVLHDTEDNDVPVSCAYDIRQNLVNSEIKITNGLGHRRILTDTEVITKMISFFNK